MNNINEVQSFLGEEFDEQIKKQGLDIEFLDYWFSYFSKPNHRFSSDPGDNCKTMKHIEFLYKIKFLTRGKDKGGYYYFRKESFKSRIQSSITSVQKLFFKRINDIFHRN